MIEGNLFLDVSDILIFYLKSIVTTQNTYLQAASDNVFDSQSFPSIH